MGGADSHIPGAAMGIGFATGASFGAYLGYYRMKKTPEKPTLGDLRCFLAGSIFYFYILLGVLIMNCITSGSNLGISASTQRWIGVPIGVGAFVVSYFIFHLIIACKSSDDQPVEYHEAHREDSILTESGGEHR